MAERERLTAEEKLRAGGMRVTRIVNGRRRTVVLTAEQVARQYPQSAATYWRTAATRAQQQREAEGRAADMADVWLAAAAS